MTALAQLRTMCKSVRLRDGQIALVGATDMGRSFAKLNRDQIIAELRTEVPDLGAPVSIDARLMSRLITGMINRVRPFALAEGDAATQAVELLEAWLKAHRDNHVHGERWLTKYRLELLGYLRPIWPTLFAYEASGTGRDRVLEGAELERVTREVFGLDGPARKAA